MSFKILYPPIGIAGLARSGKDTYARALADRAISHGLPTKRIAFADALRDVLLATDPIVYPGGSFRAKDAWRLSDVFEGAPTGADPWEWVKDNTYGPEVRRLLQRLGTEGIRAKSPYFWVDQVLSTIITDPRTLYIVTDIRFPNEAQAILAYGAVHLVRRPDPDHRRHVADHASEDLDSLADRATFTVDNTSDLADLQAIAYRVMDTYINTYHRK